MSLITNYLSHLERVKNKIPEWGNEAVINNKEEILNIIKTAQLGIGLNSFGKPLKWNHKGKKGNGYYAPSTQDIANASTDYSYDFPKSEGDPYNFFWSGNTFQFMNIKTNNDSTYEIFTTGGKQNLLETIYGEIFSLTKEHNFYVNKNIIEPYLATKIQQELFNF